MKESIFTNKTVQTIIRLIPALAFTFFTAYQIILAIFYDVSRFGRVIGIVFYLLLTVAAYLDFSEKNTVWVAHSILLITGLILLFAMRLLNISAILESLGSGHPAIVMYFVVYILTQLGTLVLIAGYLILSADITERIKQRALIILMTVAIVMFAAVLVLECILMIKYGMNIEISLKVTLVSRVMFFLGFAGIACSLMLPAPDKKHSEPQEGQYVYSDDNEDEIDLVL